MVWWGPRCYLHGDLIGQFAWKQRDRGGEKEGRWRRAEEGRGAAGAEARPSLLAAERSVAVAGPASHPAQQAHTGPDGRQRAGTPGAQVARYLSVTALRYST